MWNQLSPQQQQYLQQLMLAHMMGASQLSGAPQPGIPAFMGGTPAVAGRPGLGQMNPAVQMSMGAGAMNPYNALAAQNPQAIGQQQQLSPQMLQYLQLMMQGRPGMGAAGFGGQQ
jgi:hypothetical protein